MEWSIETDICQLRMLTPFDLPMLKAVLPLDLFSYLNQNFHFALSQSDLGISVTYILTDKSLVPHL